MAFTEKSLSGCIKPASISGSLYAVSHISADLKMAPGTTEKDYEKLDNKPQINGVELTSNKSFEDLGYHALTALEIFKLLDEVWKG